MGNWYNPHEWKEVSRNFSQSLPEVDPWLSHRSAHRMRPRESTCLMELQPNYIKCKAIRDCGGCTSDVQCLWDKYQEHCQPVHESNQSLPACL